MEHMDKNENEKKTWKEMENMEKRKTKKKTISWKIAKKRCEADDPGPACATAKLLGAQFDAIGQWAGHLPSKSEVELAPLFGRQMFNERLDPCTSLVGQGIHGTHRRVERFSLLASPELEGDLAHTQLFCGSLSHFLKTVSGAVEVGMVWHSCRFVT